jgi:hypothetical protein
MSLDTNLEQQPQQRLRTLRPLLLNLHKALMEHERATYEQAYGAIANRGEYLQLVLGHEWFNWLRPISQMIVRIDEQLNAKKPDEAESAEALLAAVRMLLTPLQDGTPVEHRYAQAIQSSPEIALLHAQFSHILG